MPAPKRSGMLLSFAVVAVFPMYGEQPVSTSEREHVVQMDELVQELLKNSPALQSAQYRVDAAMKRPS